MSEILLFACRKKTEEPAIGWIAGLRFLDTETAGDDLLASSVGESAVRWAVRSGQLEAEPILCPVVKVEWSLAEVVMAARHDDIRPA